MSLIVERVLRGARASACATMILALVLALLGAASAAQGSSSCPNELLRTGPGAHLPDCRAYELVSPPDKNGGEVDGGPSAESLAAPQQAASDGEAVTYASTTTFPETDPLSSPLAVQYLSRRGANGWSTQAITPEQNFPGGTFDAGDDAEDFTLFQGFSENLEHAFLVAYEPSPVAGAPVDYYNPYLRNNATNEYRLLSTTTPPDEPPGAADSIFGFLVEYAGMSADGSHVAFAANDALVPGAIPGRTNLYEWSEGRLELINVLPSKVAVSGERTRSDVNFGLIQFGSYQQGGQAEGFDRVVSTDGSRVIWTSASSDFGVDVGPEEGVYVSELTAAGRVVHGPVQGIYQTASVDGSKVYVKSESGLLQYEPASGSEHRIVSGEVTEVLGASEDGSRVYFDAKSVLAQGAVTGAENIYLWHEGSISFVASVGLGDYSVDGQENPGSLTEAGRDLLRKGTLMVSPNGQFLTFNATEPLTGYENRPYEAGKCREIAPFDNGFENGYQNNTGRCLEVFEYDADTGHLTCISCDRRNLPPEGNSVLPGPLHDIEMVEGWQSRTVQQRYLLSDGRVFFESTDDLLPQVSNQGEANVYEYEPNGVGTCQLEGGCLALISTGTSSKNSYFIDASADGNDVFFVTTQQLVAQDGDQAADLYDARVDGGFSSATTPPCGGEACRPAITPAPAIYQAPPSATFAGPGNPPPAPAVASAKSKHRPKTKRVKRKGKKKMRRSTRRRVRLKARGTDLGAPALRNDRGGQR